MNFLQLCSRLRQEAGVSGSGPTSVTAQTGEMKRLVDWINSAWMDIQQDMPGFDWMRGSFTLSTVVADAEYAASDASVTDLRDWVREGVTVYLTSVSDETDVVYVPYADYRPSCMTGTVSTGRPTLYTVKPDKKLHFWPTPDAIYTVTGEYQKAASELSGDSDTPELPAEYHMAIVYRAMMKYARYEAAPEIYDDAKAEYKRMMNSIKIEQLPEMMIGGPLL